MTGSCVHSLHPATGPNPSHKPSNDPNPSLPHRHMCAHEASGACAGLLTWNSRDLGVNVRLCPNPSSPKNMSKWCDHIEIPANNRLWPKTSRCATHAPSPKSCQNRILAKIISTDSFISLNGRCATSRYLQVVGSIHDIESYFGIDNTLSLNLQIFTAHWGHLTIILIWVSGNLYHIASNANYSLWVKNPIPSIPIAHNIWDPHFTNSTSTPYSHTIIT